MNNGHQPEMTALEARDQALQILNAQGISMQAVLDIMADETGKYLGANEVARKRIVNLLTKYARNTFKDRSTSLDAILRAMVVYASGVVQNQATARATVNGLIPSGIIQETVFPGGLAAPTQPGISPGDAAGVVPPNAVVGKPPDQPALEPVVNVHAFIPPPPVVQPPQSTAGQPIQQPTFIQGITNVQTQQTQGEGSQAPTDLAATDNGQANQGSEGKGPDCTIGIPEEAKPVKVYLVPYLDNDTKTAGVDSECGQKLIDDAWGEKQPASELVAALREEDYPGAYLQPINAQVMPLMEPVAPYIRGGLREPVE